MVCYDWMVERMKGRVNRLFSNGNLSSMVCMFMRRMERFLLYHMNLESEHWVLNLAAGNSLPEERDSELKMTEHLYIKLDLRCYKLLKKMHEACNTFSMAMLLRSIICFCLDGLDRYSGLNGGFWRWLREWERANIKSDEPEVCAHCPLLSSHMLRFGGDSTVKLALYNMDYRQNTILSFLPPPGNTKK